MFLQTESKRGNGLRSNGEKGFVRIDLTSNIYNAKFICVDDYQGRGEDYKKREEPKIIIGNGEETFEFESFEELINKLKE